MHPLHPVPENPPPASGHSQKKNLATDTEPKQAVESSGVSLSQEESWPNGPPPTGPKLKYNYGVSTAAMTSTGRGPDAEAGPWTLHSFGNSLQLQRAKEPSPPPLKRRRLSYDHYSPPKPSSTTPVRHHQGTQHNNDENGVAHEIHRRSPPPRGRLPPLRAFSSSDRGYDSWRPERSYERKTSPLKSTSPKLPRLFPVLSDHALNRGQETNSPSLRFTMTAKLKPTRDKLPDSALVGSQTYLPLESVNGVAKTNSAEVSDTRTILIPPLVDREPSATGSPTENADQNKSLRSPQIETIQKKPFLTSLVSVNPPRLRLETAVTGSETPLSCGSVSTSSSTPLIASSSARRNAIDKEGERENFARRGSAQRQPFAGLPTSRKQVSLGERASSGTRTPDTTLSTKSQEGEVIVLLSERARDDPDLAEVMGLVARKEATREQTTLFNDLVASLKRELTSRKSKCSPCEVAPKMMLLEGLPKMEHAVDLDTSTRESALISEVEEGKSEEPLAVPMPIPIPSEKSPENHSLADSPSGAFSGAPLDPPDLKGTIHQFRPSTTALSSILKVTTRGPRIKACESCRKKKKQCKHPIQSVPTEQTDTRGCGECEWKQILCRRHRELLAYNEADNAIATTSDSEESTNLRPAKPREGNRDSTGQPGGPTGGLEPEPNAPTPSESLEFEYRPAEDMGPNLNRKEIRVREKRVVQETPEATSSKAFENDSLVASRNFKAAKSNPNRQNARNLFTDRNEREREAGSAPSLPRCLGCGKFVFGKPRCINCETIYAENATNKNPTVIPETPEATSNGYPKPEQGPTLLPAAAESSTLSTNIAQLGRKDTLASRESSVSTQPHRLIPRKRKHDESSADSGHSNQPVEGHDYPSGDALEHRSTKLLSAHREDVLERGQSREDAETHISSLTDVRQMHAKDTQEIERLIHQNLSLQEKLDENEDEKQKQMDELENARKEIADLKNGMLSRSTELLEATEKDPGKLKQRTEPTDVPDSDTDLTLEPYAYDPSKYPPLKPYVPAYRRPRVSTDLYEIAPHLHPDNVFFDKEAKIREIGARPSRKATFGKVLAKSRR